MIWLLKVRTNSASIIWGTNSVPDVITFQFCNQIHYSDLFAVIIHSLYLHIFLVSYCAFLITFTFCMSGNRTTGNRCNLLVGQLTLQNHAKFLLSPCGYLGKLWLQPHAQLASFKICYTLPLAYEKQFINSCYSIFGKWQRRAMWPYFHYTERFVKQAWTEPCSSSCQSQKPITGKVALSCRKKAILIGKLLRPLTISFKTRLDHQLHNIMQHTSYWQDS